MSGEQKKSKQVLIDSVNRDKTWACVCKENAKRAHRAYTSLWHPQLHNTAKGKI